MICRLITRITCRISRESVSPTEVEVYSAYMATATVEASFKQIHCLLTRVSRDQRRVVAVYGVLSEQVANWDMGGSPIPNPQHTVCVLSGSSSSEPNVANDDVVRTQWDELEC